MRKNMTSLEVVDFDIALDWATFSSPPEGKERANFRDFGVDMMHRLKQHFGNPEKAKVRDYVGTRVSDTYMVQRPSDGHFLLVASGEESNRLAEEIIAHGITATPTRLDIAATARCGRDNPDYPNGIRANIKRIRTSEGKKQRQVMAIFEHQNGSTGCTLGSRTSEVYGRIYDWEAKHCGVAKFRVWRHEVEYKSGAARRLWTSYQASAKRSDVLQATLYDRMDRWHVPAPWLADSGKLKIVGTKPPTTDEKRLLHLDKVIAPFITDLIKKGFDDEVKKVLQAHGILAWLGL
jgi:hypothetical protein